MKKILALTMALILVLSLAACGAKDTTPETTAAATAAATEEAAETEAARPHFDKLTLEFVPSKDADVIIAGTENLPELVKAEMAKLGYDIDEVDITVGTSYDATGEAMSAGTIDLGWLPGGNKTVTTHWETTKTAVEAALALLRPLGVLVICAYPGHAEGDRERNALASLLAQLPPQGYNVLCQKFLNAGPGAPECFVIQRQ